MSDLYSWSLTFYSREKSCQFSATFILTSTLIRITDSCNKCLMIIVICETESHMWHRVRQCYCTYRVEQIFCETYEWLNIFVNFVNINFNTHTRTRTINTCQKSFFFHPKTTVIVKQTAKGQKKKKTTITFCLHHWDYHVWQAVDVDDTSTKYPIIHECVRRHSSRT